MDISDYRPTNAELCSVAENIGFGNGVNVTGLA